MATETVKFVRQFVYRDQHRIDNALQQYYTRPLIEINSILPEVERTIKRPLTDEEKINIARNKGEALLQHYRPSFPFENADDEFNLKALGLHIQPMLNKLNALPNVGADLEVQDGRLVLSAGFLEELEESNTQYTQNEKQNEVFDLANEMIELLHKAENLDLIDRWSMGRIEQTIKFVHTEEGKLIPNRHVIRDIM